MRLSFSKSQKGEVDVDCVEHELLTASVQWLHVIALPFRALNAELTPYDKPIVVTSPLITVFPLGGTGGLY